MIVIKTPPTHFKREGKKHKQVRAWLRANGLEPGRIPAHLMWVEGDMIFFHEVIPWPADEDSPRPRAQLHDPRNKHAEKIGDLKAVPMTAHYSDFGLKVKK